VAALQQRRCNFIRLQSRWANSLASSVRFATHVKEAINIAIAISGDSRTFTDPQWVNTTTLTAPDLEGEGDPVPVDLDELPQVDSEQATLADVLEGEMGALDVGDDNDLTDLGCDANATIVWEVPEVCYGLILCHITNALW
jgi:hypothetical protein